MRGFRALVLPDLAKVFKDRDVLGAEELVHLELCVDAALCCEDVVTGIGLLHFERLCGRFEVCEGALTGSDDLVAD